MDVTVNNVYFKSSESTNQTNKIIIKHYKSINDWPNNPAGYWELGFRCKGKINISGHEFLTIQIDPIITSTHDCRIVYHNQFDKRIELVNYGSPIPDVDYDNNSKGRRLIPIWIPSKWYLKISGKDISNHLILKTAVSGIQIASGNVEVGDDNQILLDEIPPIEKAKKE